jgi:uncharacterized protein YndB with AHSA1/START domain
MSDSGLGRLDAVEQGWQLVFRRHLEHSPERVWRAITEPDELAAWFPDRVSGSWQVGEALTFASAQAGTFTGRVLVCDPPRVLSYTWGTDVLRFEIEPEGTGCVLTLLDTLTPLGKGARDAAGWHVCLDSLAAHLDRRPLQADAGERWTAIHPHYVSAFGPEATTIGPPG